jgi:hypothetical protein
MRFQLIFGFFSGGAFFSSVLGLHENSYGDVDGYCAHLRDHWVDARALCVVVLVVTAIGMTLGMTVFPKLLKHG